MFDHTSVQTVLVTAGQIVLGWTGLSVLAASAWSLHRAPGRDVRLALEDRALALATEPVVSSRFASTRRAA